MVDTPFWKGGARQAPSGPTALGVVWASYKARLGPLGRWRPSLPQLNKSRNERSPPLVQGSMARDKFQTQLHIKSALSERDTRAAVLIAESIRNALDLLDVQPPTVIEVIVSLAKERQRTGNFPKHRSELREALIKYRSEERRVGKECA